MAGTRQDELVFETRGAIVRELVARWALFALVVGFPLLYLPGVLLGEPGGPAGSPLGRTAPAAPPPAWVHLLVVTTGGAPDAVTRQDAPELWAWREASAVATNLVLPSAASAANAATLWTGRWPGHHGVTANDLALAGAPWTLAEAARAGGARTFALLEAPFASATRIRGFQEVLEAPAVDDAELAGAVRRAIASAAGERVVLWLHLREAGASRLDRVLGAVRSALAEDERWAETLAVLLPLESASSRAAAWVRFPGVDWGGRRGTSPLALVDLTAVLRSALRVEPPDPLAREPALQGRPSRALDVLRGWDVDLELGARRVDAEALGVDPQPAALGGEWRSLEGW